MEKSTDFGPQTVSVVASVTAGISSVVTAQLTKRFPVSFHTSSPRWKYTIIPVLGYFAVYVALLLYGMLRNKVLSTTLAFMASPGVPLHGFIWALIPQTRYATKAPSTDSYLLQCFSRKRVILLVLSWAPFIATCIFSGVNAAGRGWLCRLQPRCRFWQLAVRPKPSSARARARSAAPDATFCYHDPAAAMIQSATSSIYALSAS